MMPRLKAVSNFRIRMGLTQDEFAADAKVSTATLQRAEAGQSVSEKSAKRIADTLGVHVERITLTRSVTILGYVIEESQVDFIVFLGLQFIEGALDIIRAILADYRKRRKP